MPRHASITVDDKTILDGVREAAALLKAFHEEQYRLFRLSYFSGWNTSQPEEAKMSYRNPVRPAPPNQLFRLANENPIVGNFMSLFRAGGLSWEQMLVSLVCELAEANENLRREAIRTFEEQPVSESRWPGTRHGNEPIADEVFAQMLREGIVPGVPAQLATFAEATRLKFDDVRRRRSKPFVDQFPAALDPATDPPTMLVAAASSTCPECQGTKVYDCPLKGPQPCSLCG